MEYKWTVLSNTTLGTLLAAIDGSILMIALPVVFRGLHVDPFLPQNFTLLIWILLGYGIVTATLLVTFGRLSDMWGRARMYNLGFAVFAVGSLLLFLTPNLGTTGAWEIIIFRLVQAVGGAFLFSNSAALITDAFPPSERGRALGINMVAYTGGSVLGLVLGGILAGIPDFSLGFVLPMSRILFLHLPDIAVGPFVLPTWRTIFLVSVPVSIFGAIWAYYKLHETATIRAGQKIDYLGNITFGLGLTVLLVASTYGLLPYGGQSMGWSNPWVWAGMIGGVLLLALFFVIEMRVPDPMFRLELFRIRAFAAGNAASLFGSIARGGLMFMLIIWLQGIWLPLHGYLFADTPFWAGVYMLPMMIGFAAMGPLSGWLADRFGARYLASAGMALAGVSLLVMITLPYDFYYPELAALLFLNGVGMGMFASPNAAAVMNSVPPEHRGAASGMRATLQNTGQQLSMALFFTIIIVGVASGLSGSVSTHLTAAHVDPTDTAILSAYVAKNPTGAIFGAFLGENPMGTLIRNLNTASPHGWTPLPANVAAELTSNQFFPNAVAPSFVNGIDIALLMGGILTLVGAAVSLMRGKTYVHEARGPPSAAQGAQASGSGSKFDPIAEGTKPLAPTSQGGK
ncbi:MAG: MFS transporter [Thermoplasmatota archaeon]